ncbi:MAG: ammonium transporter [Hyphomicrobiaceae bacterium]
MTKRRTLPACAAKLASTALAGLFGLILAGSAAVAQDAAPVPDKGDTAWMMVASALVLLMTVPGLALFYGGLVRSKNMLSVLMQVLYSTAVVCIIWVFYGYSLAFTNGGSLNSFIGGFDRLFLAGVGLESNLETFTKGVVIPEYVFIVFQMTFAAITPALIVGAMAERIRFAAIALFIPLWVTFVYFPMAHMVWFWGGPSAYGDPAGFIFSLGAVDFAGGTVVHINSGIAALVGALLIGRRVGYRSELMAPHSLTMTLIGGGLLWVGWFGFNAGSALEASSGAVLAMLNTFVATAAASLGWILMEVVRGHKPSLLGAISGVVAGLVAVTPAAGLAGPVGAICLGFLAGAICFLACTSLKNRLGYDDSLDVFGVHGVGGIVGAIGTGIVAAPALGGTGIFDYATGAVADYSIIGQVLAQAKAVIVTVIWSGIGSLALFKLVDLVVGLRVATEEEREGLDLSGHGERAYNY